MSEVLWDRGQFVMACSHTSFPPPTSTRSLRTHMTAQSTHPNAKCPLSQREKSSRTHVGGQHGSLLTKHGWGVRGEGHRGVLFGFFFCLFLKASLKYNFRTIKLSLFSVEFGGYQCTYSVLWPSPQPCFDELQSFHSLHGSQPCCGEGACITQ